LAPLLWPGAPPDTIYPPPLAQAERNGRTFDLITHPGWTHTALIGAALAVMGAAVSQGLTGLFRNYANEFMAQRIERDARHELYVSLLGKSQTYHGR